MKWLLERCGVDEALLGDIDEERRAGRSAWWLTRQVSVAIARTTLREWRLHPWLALRAILVGWLLSQAWGLGYKEMLFRLLPDYLSNEWARMGLWSVEIVNWIVIPYAVARIVAILHRPHSASMGLLWVGCLNLLLTVQWAAFAPRDIIMVSWLAVIHLITVLGALAGGLLLPGARRRPNATPHA